MSGCTTITDAPGSGCERRPRARAAPTPAMPCPEDEQPTVLGWSPSALWRVVTQTAREFLDDDCTKLAGSLAYYAVLSLPPALALIITVAGTMVEPEAVQMVIRERIQDVVSPRAAAQIEAVLGRVSRPEVGGVGATLLSLGVLVLGATAAFAQLQDALNRVWGVQQRPDRSEVRKYLVKRLFSFGMIVVLGLLLLVSLVVSTLLSAFGQIIRQLLSPGLSQAVLRIVEGGVSFAALIALLAAAFTVVPDARVRWRHAGVGAAVTAILFTAGEYVLTQFLGHTNPGSAYGAAGSLVLVLIWIYFLALILLLGAEFTQVFARARGGGRDA